MASVFKPPHTTNQNETLYIVGTASARRRQHRTNRSKYTNAIAEMLAIGGEMQTTLPAGARWAASHKCRFAARVAQRYKNYRRGARGTQKMGDDSDD